MSDTPLLELRGVSKHFGAVIALHEVDFKVHAGCVTALVGDNGAGKSTLIKCVAGIYRIDGGEVVYEGKPVTSHTRARPRTSASRSSTRTSRWPTTSTWSRTCSSGARSSSALRTLDETKMEARARDTLKSLSVTTIRSVRQTVAGLSGGQRQSVAVAKAVMWNSKLVILDEPTAALGRGPDAPGARPRQAPRRAGPRRDPHLAQPARHLRGGGRHHGAAAGPERGRVQAHARRPRRRSSTRSPPAS